MIARFNVMLLLGLASNISARRIAKKGQHDLSAERWGRIKKALKGDRESDAITTTTTIITNEGRRDLSSKRWGGFKKAIGGAKGRKTTATTTMIVTLTKLPEAEYLSIANLPLPDCLSISTYPGKCSISQHPGACYAEDDDVWQCWSDSQPKETMTEKTCTEIVGKHGACVFKDHFMKPSGNDLKLCTDVPGFNSQCHPLTEMWGACYNKDLDDWRCIRKDDPDTRRYHEGDCKSTSTAADGKVAYDDVCVVPSVENIAYKCPGVPTYKEGDPAFSCLQEDIAFACFSLREGVTWQCISSDTSVPSCMSIQLPITEQAVTGETYDGVCVHASSPFHRSAISADNLVIRTTPTPTTTSTTNTPTSTASPATTTTIAEQAINTADGSAPKTATPATPAKANSSTKSGTIKSQLNGLTMVVFFLMSRANLM